MAPDDHPGRKLTSDSLTATSVAVIVSKVWRALLKMKGEI